MHCFRIEINIWDKQDYDMQTVINNTYQQVFVIGHIEIFSFQFSRYKGLIILNLLILRPCKKKSAKICITIRILPMTLIA
jgi:hypothetical protein